MRSIFLNKRFPQYLMLVVFIFIGFKSLSQESKVNQSNQKTDSIPEKEADSSAPANVNKTIDYTVPLNKSETKMFFKRLINIYGKDLKQIHGEPINQTIANSTTETLYSGKQKYNFKLTITLNDKNQLEFKDPRLDSLRDAYEGKSDDLERLLKKMELSYSHPASDRLKQDYLKNPIYVTLSPNSSFIKRYYNRQWRTYRRPDRLTLGVFGGVNFSTAFVSPFQYSDDAELKTQTRRENEGYLPTGIYGFSAGYSHYSHGVDVFFQRTNYGAKYIQENIVDWNTGYYGGDSLASDSTKLSFPVGQWGIRYRYSNYHRKISPYVAVGIHISYVKMSSKDLLRLNSQYLSTGCNLGLGLNIHPIYALDIHIAPVMNISFNAVKGSELQTRFSSIALEVGLRYNIALGKKEQL